MFEYKSISAFILRLAIFFLLFSTYPLVHYFLNTMLLQLFWKNTTLSKKAEFLLTVAITSVPLMFALFYPNVGTVLAYTGALSGFLIIYVLPVMVYLKQMKTKIEHPILAEAIRKNEFEVKGFSGATSPKIRVNDRFLTQEKELQEALVTYQIS